MANIQKVSFLLNGGQDEQSAPELGGPIAAQGGSLTLRESLNTRLGQIPGSCTHAPSAVQTTSFTTTPGYALIPAEAGKNTLVVTPPRLQSRVVDASGLTGVTGAGLTISDLPNVQRPGAYIPARISAAGAVPSCQSATPPAVCATTTGDNLVWVAFVKPHPESGDPQLFLTASFADGSVCAPAIYIADLPSAYEPWYALTSHHSHGVRLWYREDATTLTIKSALCTGNLISTATLASFVPIEWTVPPHVVTCAIPEYGGVVDATYAAYAVLATTSSTQIVARTINVVTGVITYTHTIPSVVSSPQDVAIGFGSYGSGGTYVGIGLVNAASMYSYQLGWTPTSMSAGGVFNVAGVFNTIAIQWYRTTVSVGFVAAVSHDEPFDNPAAYAGTKLYYTVFGDPAEYDLPWQRLYSKGSTVKLAPGEVYPIFDTVPCYSNAPELPDSPNYPLDPAVTAYLVATPTNVVPVARFACPRASLSPVRVDPTAAFVGAETPVPAPVRQSAAECISAEGPTQVRFHWLKDILDFATAEARTGETPGNGEETSYPARFTQISFTPVQPSIAHDKSGTALVAGALPVQWDGEAIVEIGGPLFTPKLAVNTFGIGPDYPAGAYRFGCHWEWYDAAGLLHRSAPAIINWETDVPAKPYLIASAPLGFKDGQLRSAPKLVTYASPTDAPATLHRLGGVTYKGEYSYDQTLVPLPETSRQVLYTDGSLSQQQPPLPPPPTRDWTIVGDRIVGIDDEVPNRIFYSKRRISGVGFEFSPFYEFLLPSGVGDALAVREWQGTIVIFCERAVLQVGGDGPDNLVGNPSGGAFSPPVRVGSVGCTNRRSVLTTPKGILFQRDTDILSFSGAEPVLVPGVQVSNVTGAYLLPDQDEAVFVLGAAQKAYNYRLGRWTTWNITESDAPEFVAQVPWANNQAILGTKESTKIDIRLVDGLGTSTTGSMRWTSDWIVLSGDFQDRVNLQWLVFSARRLSAHGLKIEVFTNYDERTFVDVATTPNTTEVNYSSAEISAWAERYTVRVDPLRTFTRAVKFRITESRPGGSVEGVLPICMSLYFRVEGNYHEDMESPGAHR